jgi:hypothetical protein
VGVAASLAPQRLTGLPVLQRLHPIACDLRNPYRLRRPQLNPVRFINRKTLERATIVGVVLQIAMVIAGHFIPWVAEHVFMFGGMMISATAGYLYAMDSGPGFGIAALGGAIAGGTCALIGIALSVIMRDVPEIVLVFGTVISTVTGAIGGLFGQMAANMRRMG